MSAVLIRPNNENYVIEVVKSLNRSMPVDVTSNPVENGSNISDHVVTQNKTWTIEGVISDATFNYLDDNNQPVFTPDAVIHKLSGSEGKNSTVVTTNRPTVGTGVGNPNGPSLTTRLRSFAGAQLGFITQFLQEPIKVYVTTTPTSDSKPKYLVDTYHSKRYTAYEKYRLLEEIRDNREILTLQHSSGVFENLVITNVEPVRDASISSRSFVFTLSLTQVQVIDKAKSVEIAKRKPKPAPKPNKASSDMCSGKGDEGKKSGTQVTESQMKGGNKEATPFRKFKEGIGSLGGL